MHRLYRLLIIFILSTSYASLYSCFNWENTKNDRTEKQYLQKLAALERTESLRPSPGYEQELNRYMTLGEEKNFFLLQQKTALLLARNQNRLKNYQKAIAHTQTGFVLGVQDDFPICRAELHYEQGRAAQGLQRFRQGLDQFNKAAVLFESLKQQKSLVQTQQMLADVYRQTEDFKSAAQALQKALELISDADSLQPFRAAIVNRLTEILIAEKEYEPALPFVHEKLEIKVAAGDKNEIAATLSELAEVKGGMGQTDSSIYYLDSAIKIQTSGKDPSFLANSYLRYARLFMERDSLQAADSMLVLAKPLILTFADPRLQKMWSETAAAIAEGKGDYQTALDISKKNSAREDSLYRVQHRAEYAGWEKEAEASRTQLEFYRRRDQFMKQQLQTWAAGGLLLLLCGTGGWIYFLYRTQVRLRRSLEHRKLQLEDLKEQRNGIKDLLAHKIRNPLYALLAVQKLMFHNTHLHPVQEQYPLFLQAKGIQLIETLNRIAESPKEASLASSDMLVPVQLSLLLSQLQEHYRSSVRGKNIYFRLHTDGLIPEWLLADPVWITQIFGILLQNAEKHSYTDGEITTTLTLTEKTKYEASLLCSVADKGKGMSKVAHQHLFDALRQEKAEKKDNENQKDYPPGLKTVNEMLLKMNSRLHIESKEGKGSTFSFTLALPVYNPSTNP